MEIEHFDVLIVGAGLSGIGAACHLQSECPDRTFAVLEAREVSGGTWDLFRYPGIRSDSDMFTLGYSFKPWEEPKVIADGPAILSYIRETAREHGVDRHIRYGRRVLGASWSSATARWTVQIECADGAAEQLSCSFLFGNTGYYRYDEGYSPAFPGSERFTGQIVHPQHWPEDLDVGGRRVVVIGSGATAVTLIPALAERGAHVTMLQRSPSYVFSLPLTDPLADWLRRRLSARAAYPIVRWKNVMAATLMYWFCRRAPRTARRLLKRGIAERLPAGYDVDTHFEPRYDPWDQRLCLVPDGDLFKVLGDGRAEVVTGQIETFTEDGVRLSGGRELAADVIVTATGLNLLLLGGLTLEVDGAPVDYRETVAYKGMMLSGVPNMAFTVGYTNASWTLKADLVARYVCRLLNHMRAHGFDAVTPTEPPDAGRTPIMDLQAGYVLRAVDSLPTQGAHAPWRLHQNYLLDHAMFTRAPLEDEGVLFTRARGDARVSGRPLVAA